MDKLLAGLTTGLLMFCSVAWAENEATFDFGTGVLNIPRVDVSSVYYNVDMQQQGEGLDFSVSGANPSTSSSSENTAVYSPSTGDLLMPAVIVANVLYKVQMQQKGDGLNFSVTIAEPVNCYSDNLDLCTTSSTCSDAGGYWWSDHTCNSTLEATSTTGKDTTTAVVTVISTTGRVWMDRNLGASRVALSSTDEEAYGDLYQWGRGADGHEKRTSGTTSTLSSTDIPGHGDFITNDDDWRSSNNDNLWQGLLGANNPCPDGFRVPTMSELDGEFWLYGSKGEFQFYGSTTDPNLYESPLKIVDAGSRSDETGSIATGIGGNYWTSTVSSSNIYKACTSETSDTSGGSCWNKSRSYGNSVRCILD